MKKVLNKKTKQRPTNNYGVFAFFKRILKENKEFLK
ncbi:hypothetical protein SAMN05192532_103120 [Alteribacillus iranensis]|uniref:Uncharacterized protein n=1 Tax=Alteribacillus iranensis TaxID=930128 RepID=A0A1I2CP65_9BACI|nr:hypothetical protein SAMN05192532_103120 [Alteribacillus iranensis]